MTRVPAEDEQQQHVAESPSRRGELGRFQLSAAMFDQFCSGAVEDDTMAVLEKSQYSHRRLALRALFDQLAADPDAVGSRVAPEESWRILAAAERRDADAVSDILLYPTVGVWLTRALHYTRPNRASSTVWPELGYLQLIAAAAAIRSGLSCTVSVPVWHGVVSLPTVGQVRLPGVFPVGVAELVCAGPDTRLRVSDSVSVRLDPASLAFTPTRQHVCESRGLTLRAWFEDCDPYRGFGEPRRPSALLESAFAEWRKLVSEAWDVLTLSHRAHARELSAGLRALVPIDSDSDVVGSSSPAAFGGIGLSANGSAVELAEAMVHELQHSKLNALLGLVTLVQDSDGSRCYAPWRDDPRHIQGLVHGAIAFTCGVEFWITQRDAVHESDFRGVEFDIAFRRLQARRVVRFLLDSRKLSRLGYVLIDAISQRLWVCEQAPITPELLQIVTVMVDDHRAQWRLRFVQPNTTAVDSLAAAWLDGTTLPERSLGDGQILGDDGRRLPANRRNLLRAKALEPDLFTSLMRRPASLPGTTPRADAALCVGDNGGAATAYRAQLRTDPSDLQAWVGLGIALREQGHTLPAAALLGNPEVTVAAYHRVRLLGGEPDPGEFASWVGAAL